MGIEIEDNGPPPPPLFKGKAISIRLPDQPQLSPQGKQIIIQGELQWQALWTTTFPDWAHKVHTKDGELEILGKDLEKDMIIKFPHGPDNLELLIKDIDKEQLYCGLMEPKIKIGIPTEKQIPRYKMTRNFYEDNRIEWVAEEISS